MARHTERAGADESLAGTPRSVRDRRRRSPAPLWDRAVRFAGARRPADRVVVSSCLGIPAPGRSGARDTPDGFAPGKGRRSWDIADSGWRGPGRPPSRGPSPCRPNGRAERTDAGRDRGPGCESTDDRASGVESGDVRGRPEADGRRPGVSGTPAAQCSGCEIVRCSCCLRYPYRVMPRGLYIASTVATSNTSRASAAWSWGMRSTPRRDRHSHLPSHAPALDRDALRSFRSPKW